MKSKLERFRLYYEQDFGIRDIHRYFKWERRKRKEEMLFALQVIATSILCSVAVMLVLIRCVPDELDKKSRS